MLVRPGACPHTGDMDVVSALYHPPHHLLHPGENLLAQAEHVKRLPRDPGKDLIQLRKRELVSSQPQRAATSR
ncbi:hypothetical protein GGTG_13180 [Gaeumannomyces tritici R3-111a-1]|uniref:Uncharacterized protein n=1 Tax=Gaeumannomyces tritici (strain R3-111a-1) TaxID=644352 RepID=J3PI50_GAET3|nr:hypothetical protein GGTG_13180 [Gaeumannomyces tritici R3-111a-1]EJT69562.1 hypothetical protein GGTG_13180 [Gaeumannomyces tritici R3-111a-1]